MYLTRWSPTREMRRMDETMNRLWRGFGSPRDWEEEAWNIPLDVTENKGELLVKASLPGVEPDKIQINVEDNVLSISAEVSEEKSEEEENYLLHERNYGSFYRALRLPDSVNTEKIESCYDKGILYVSLPKPEEMKKKKIEVKVGKAPQIVEAKSKKK